MKKRLMCLILTVILLLTIVPSAAASGICFVGVNDSVPMYLSAGEAPYYKNGALYVPYTVFNASPGGIAVSYNGDKGSLALFTRAKRLVYDLNEGTLTDESQKTNKVDTVYRNGILFVPLARVANHFGLQTKMLTSAGGSSILRFTDGSQTLEDATFVRKAETLISIILEQQEQKPADKDAQEPEEEERAPEGPATIYLAFAGDGVSQETLQALADYQVSATFFLTQKQIIEQQALLRQIYAAGHKIGLTVEQGDTEYRVALQAANDALDQVLFCKSQMALLPYDAPDMRQYIIFRQTGTDLETLLENDDVPHMYVCRTDASYALQRLRQAETNLPQLLETSKVQ